MCLQVVFSNMDEKLDRLIESNTNLQEQMQIMNSTLLSLPQGLATAIKDNNNAKEKEDNYTRNTEEVEKVDNIPLQG